MSLLTCTALTVGLSIASYHPNRAPGYNEFNPGVYVQCDNVAAGFYRNSIDRTSAFAGYEFRHGRYGVLVGAVTGYYEPVLPLVLPSVRFGSVRLSAIPPLPGVDAAVHVAYEFKF